jgi:hypothetical protein
MDGSGAAGRKTAAAETFDNPDGFDTRFWRKKLVLGPLPFRLNVMALGTGAIDALRGRFRRRRGRVFGEFAFLFKKRGDFVFDFFFALGVQ